MFFKKKTQQPQIDEVWELNADTDPWAEPFNVKIIDIKKNWVRFSFITKEGLLGDNRQKMDVFLSCYKFYEEK